MVVRLTIATCSARVGLMLILDTSVRSQRQQPVNGRGAGCVASRRVDFCRWWGESKEVCCGSRRNLPSWLWTKKARLCLSKNR